jgi:hypothetical protein
MRAKSGAIQVRNTIAFPTFFRRCDRRFCFGQVVPRRFSIPQNCYRESIFFIGRTWGDGMTSVQRQVGLDVPVGGAEVCANSGDAKTSAVLSGRVFPPVDGHRLTFAYQAAPLVGGAEARAAKSALFVVQRDGIARTPFSPASREVSEGQIGVTRAIGEPDVETGE